MDSNGEETANEDYTAVLVRGSYAKWKLLLNVQLPYRLNLQSLHPGKVLDVGCGIGRNLANLSADSVGVDHNKHSVDLARDGGYTALTTDEFKNSGAYGKDSFDSMLLAHVLEHLSTENGKKIIQEYLPYVKSKVIIICPQEKGFKSDETHVNFLRHKDIEKILEDIGLRVTRSYSFPFHRSVGKVFKHNETVVVGEKTH